MMGADAEQRRGGVHNWLLQVATAASFWVGVESYGAYRLMRALGNHLHGASHEVQSGPIFDAGTAVIEGFRHSANSFVVGNIDPSAADRIRSHVHRPWILRAAARAGAPTVVMIRRPRDACLSLCHRSSSAQVMTYGVALSPFFALLAWVGYYRVVWRLRRQLLVVDFDQLERDPAATLRRIGEHTGLPIRAELSFATRHHFDGPRPALRLGFFARLALRHAEELHHRLTSPAGARRSHGSSSRRTSRAPCAVK